MGVPQPWHTSIQQRAGSCSHWVRKWPHFLELLHKSQYPAGLIVAMVTCNKIPFAQHGRRGKRLKLNTVTLRENLLAHTNSRGTKQTNQAGLSGFGPAGQLQFRGWCQTVRHIHSNRNSNVLWLLGMTHTHLLDLYLVRSRVFFLNLKLEITKPDALPFILYSLTYHSTLGTGSLKSTPFSI